MRCESCTARFPDPDPAATEIDRYYGDQLTASEWEMEHFVEIRPEQRQGWYAFADKLTRLNGGPGRVLELGCAAGWLLRGLVDHGWRAVGLEASPKFATSARNVQGLNVLLGTVEQDGVAQSLHAEGPFDLIVLVDVLEHVHDPVGLLRTLRPLLTDDGRFVVATLDIDSAAASHYGLAWRQYVISHIVYWTRRSLGVAFDRAGFDVRAMADIRSWDPDPSRRRRSAVREATKFGLRLIALRTYYPLAERFPAVKQIPGAITRGRLDHDLVVFKVGDQPVIGDVLIVIATKAVAPRP